MSGPTYRCLQPFKASFFYALYYIDVFIHQCFMRINVMTHNCLNLVTIIINTKES